MLFVLGTLLKGEPIISLPPKTIMLKKVDFTAEERGFYQSLEAEARAQFEVCVCLKLEQLTSIYLINNMFNMQT